MNEITTFHKDLLVVDHTRLDSMSQNELADLVKETNGRALKAAKQTLLHIGQTGLVLIALKAKLDHGQFMRSVESMTKIDHRTANNYMTIARHYGNVSNLRGVRDALRYIKNSASAAIACEKRTHPEAFYTAPTPSTPRSPLPMGAIQCDAEIVEPAPNVESVSSDEIDEDDIEPLVMDGTKPAPAPPKEDDKIISIRVSTLKDIIAEIDEGLKLIRSQETTIEDAIEAEDIKLTGNGEDIMDVYISAVSKAKRKIGFAIDRLEWNVPQNLRGI